MYTRELQNKGGTHSFSEKLTSLEFLFEMMLSGVGNLQHLDQGQVGDYGFELILTGYDTDGTAKIGKLVFDTSLSADGKFSPVIKQLSEKTVERELVYEKAGIGGAAVENILEHPAQLADEPEIGRYAKSKATDHGSSLTTAEMEALAKSLAHHSRLVNSKYVSGFRKVELVGGPNQIAILEKGSIQKVDQPTLSFERRRLDMPRFSILIDMTFGGGVTIHTGEILLFLKSSFRDGVVDLDRAYYFEDDFRNVTIHYDGGVLGFDPSNRVTDCVLSLGPHVDRNSAAVQELIARFPWKTVQ